VTDLEANKIAKKQLMQELRVVHNCNSDYLVEYYGVFEDEARNVVMW
jgi:mitogen-activated protein kinase kinase